MTRSEDVSCAVTLGVDAIGLILVPESPRAVDLDGAVRLRALIPPMVAAVCLLRNADEALVHAAIKHLRPDLLQFHGDEGAAFCEQFQRPYLKALAIQTAPMSLEQAFATHPNAAGFIIDSHAPGGMGGSGRIFDWSRLDAPRDRPWLLAGGLSSDNVSLAVSTTRPFAVDVASGIESAPGIKDQLKMRSFIEEVRRVDHA